jgi:3-deoxy-D-manno-octulosonate 8-phosphate phosphatase (KDO 8-P phosphatase)
MNPAPIPAPPPDSLSDPILNLRPQARERARALRLMAFDVDGTLTDGSIYIGATGELFKRFSVHDGLGLVWLREAGIEVALITGRRSDIVAQRARELGITTVLQGVADKATVLRQCCDQRGLALESCGFMGDDWPDLPALQIAGLAATVAQAPEALRQAAHWQASQAPGAGAVREFAEFILEARGELASRVARFDGRRA